MTTSVQGIRECRDAAEVFNVVKEIAKTCAGYDNEADTFERITAPLIQPAGDDSFNLYASKTTTGLIVADHFVLRGPFVFDVRWAIASISTMNVGISGVVVDQAVKKFIAWSDEQI